MPDQEEHVDAAVVPEPAPEPVLERRFLGVVEVDSGTLVIGDPAYLLPNRERQKPGVDYEEVLQVNWTQDAARVGDGLGLLLNVMDDGPYAVFAEYDKGELDGIYITGPIELEDGE